jgi:hypothetical protein
MQFQMQHIPLYHSHKKYFQAESIEMLDFISMSLNIYILCEQEQKVYDVALTDAGLLSLKHQ